jgi:DNA-binding MarR family transcriptional regulator
MNGKNRKIFKKFENRKEKYIGRLSALLWKHHYASLEKMWQEKGFGDIRNGHLPLIFNIDPEGISVNILAEKALITKQAISQILKEVEELGYVESQPDEKDKRAKVVKLTQRGIDFIATMLECARVLEKNYIKIIGEEKLQQLTELQYELVKGLYPQLYE